MQNFISFLLIIIMTTSTACSQSSDNPYLEINATTGQLSLTTEGASYLSSFALECIHQEYPNKLSHVINNANEVKGPRELHPAFYGCFDWHSSVHGHWTLVKLLKNFPNMEKATEIRERLGANLTRENIAREVAYIQEPGRKSFERMYGWSWLLQLALELETWDDAQGKEWANNLEPLAKEISSLYIDFLPRQTYPIRTGVHPNTAFGLAFALDYAREVEDSKLEEIIVNRARDYFLNDKGCPASWEPSGSDFLSPCLQEADLMRRVLPQSEFQAWFKEFLPELPSSLENLATVADRSDGQIVHLDGLNLSRGWCFNGIASALDENDPMKKRFMDLATKHITGTVPQIASGDYAGEHWLASFAIYALGLE
jgi:hypothetical protein